MQRGASSFCKHSHTHARSVLPLLHWSIHYCGESRKCHLACVRLNITYFISRCCLIMNGVQDGSRRRCCSGCGRRLLSGVCASAEASLTATSAQWKAGMAAIQTWLWLFCKISLWVWCVLVCCGSSWSLWVSVGVLDCLFCFVPSTLER